MIKEGTLVGCKDVKVVVQNGQSLFDEWVFGKVGAYDDTTNPSFPVYHVEVTKGFAGDQQGKIRIITVPYYQVYDANLIGRFIYNIDLIKKSTSNKSELVAIALRHVAVWVNGILKKERSWPAIIDNKKELLQYLKTFHLLGRIRKVRKERQLGLIKSISLSEIDSHKEFGDMVHEMWTDMFSKTKVGIERLGKISNQCEAGAPIYRASQDKRLLITL